MQIANFGGGFTAVESPTSTYPPGERLQGQRMVGEEISGSVGSITSHLVAVSAAATVGCTVPVPARAQTVTYAARLFNDATSGPGGQPSNTSTDLQNLLNALTGGGVDVGSLVGTAIANCAGWAP